MFDQLDDADFHFRRLRRFRFARYGRPAQNERDSAKQRRFYEFFHIASMNLRRLKSIKHRIKTAL
jgi:hypothetical protein